MNQNTMMLVSPAAVKHYRKKREMTQAQLADIEDEHKLTRKTINAIENSNLEGKKVHRAIYDSLLSRLEITPNQIIGNELDENQSEEGEVFSGTSLKAWINDDDFTTRDKITSSLESNYKKVCETYNANITDILSLAPLLFSQLAEKCSDKEMKEFSEAEKNDGYKTNIKYVLNNYFREFTLHKSCKPQYKHSTLFENALAFYKKKGRKIDWFSSPMDVQKLINNIYLRLLEKDVFFRKITNDTDNKEHLNPMTKFILKILNKKSIKNIFYKIYKNQKLQYFQYSNVIEYRLLEDIDRLREEHSLENNSLETVGEKQDPTINERKKNEI